MPPYYHAPEARTGIAPKGTQCPECGGWGNEHLKIGDGGKCSWASRVSLWAAGPRHAKDCPKWAKEAAKPSGLTECPDCHSRWAEGTHGEWHMPACPKFAGLAAPDERAAYVEGTRDAYRLAPGLRSWATCPCGQPARPGNVTRTNAYRGGELVEVHYPHEGGAECCWTREKRR